MTARPGRRRSARTEFPEVPIPGDVLDRAQAAPGLEGVDVVEDYLREIHGPRPDNREDRERWRAYHAATRGRVWNLFEEGLLWDNPR